jgi:ABC-type oligopeptide transport system substrate-binding subunit
MKKFRFFFLMMAVLLVMCLSFTACDSGGGDPTYTVWYNDFNFSNSDSNYGNLGDGYHRVIQLTNSSFEFERNTNYTPAKGATQKSWTVDQIASHLVSWGFDRSTAINAANDLVSKTHGELGARIGNRLYCILK